MASMPKNNGKSKNHSKGASRGASKAKKMGPLISAAMASSGANDHFIRTDVALRPPSNSFTARPPKNLSNQIFWIKQTNSAVVNSSTTGIFEYNFAFSAASNMQAGFLSYFDQYALHSATVTISSQQPPGSLATPPQVVTAIDFDNVVALANIQALSYYGTANIAVLSPGQSVTRYIEPCLATSVSSTNAGLQRIWLDSAYNSPQYYGFRSILGASISAVISYEYVTTCIWAFRNTL
jgi:hypothetical protein